MNIEDLYEVFHQCRGVYIHEDTSLIYVWYGGPSIGVWTDDGEKVTSYLDHTIADYDDFEASVFAHVIPIVEAMYPTEKLSNSSSS